jgi:competence protein ComEC
VNPLIASLAGTLLSAGFLLIGTKRFPPGSEVFLPLALLLVFVPVAFLAWRVNAPQMIEFPYEGRASVVSERSWGGRRAVVFRSDAGCLLTFVSPERAYWEGREVCLTGRIVPLEKLFPNSNGNFDAALYWRGKGIMQGFRAERIEDTEKQSCGPVAWRTALRKKLLLSLPPLLRGHLLAAWTGERDPEVADLHRRWGTAHLLAVSGFHVGILAALLLWCLQGFQFKLLWSSAVLWIYVLLTGGAASACRAMTMIQLSFLGPMLAGRPSSGINSVSVAGGLLLLLNPWLFWDIGWRLSVISALVICSLIRKRSGRIAVFASVAIWLSTAGEASRVFESVPVSGLLLNLVALPVFSLLLPVASIAAFPVLAGIPGGRIPALGMEGVFQAWTSFANTVCAVIPWQIPYTPPIGNLSAIVLGGAVGYGLGLGWKRTVLMSILAASCVSLFS